LAIGWQIEQVYNLIIMAHIHPGWRGPQQRTVEGVVPACTTRVKTKSEI